MNIYKNHPVVFKLLGLTFVGTSAGWIYYQIKRTKYILENAVDTSVLDVKAIPLQEEDSEEYIEVPPFLPYEKSNLFHSTWDSIKFAYARRLVRVAKSDDREYRVKAVKHLAKVKNLDQWHCSLLANMIDPRTAVGLARSGDADNRLLMEPPLRYHNYNKDMLVNAMRDFLISLFEKSQHPCLGYFLSKVFVYEHGWKMPHRDNFHIVDNDSSALELSKFIQSESDVLPKCLESLIHHSSIEKYARDIVDLNGLPLLMEIHHRNSTNTSITIKLCQILSFMSYDRSLLEPIHKSGWISLLSQWIHHHDVRVSVPAARALANLDFDNDCLYSRRLYLLHPFTRTTKEDLVDVVFIHGLLGGVFYTWRQRHKNQTAVGFLGKKPQKESLALATEEIEHYFAKKSLDFFRDLKDQMEIEDICRDYELVWEDIPSKTNIEAEGPFTCPNGRFKMLEGESKIHTQCWPKDWLGKDCEKLRIIGINYDTSLSMWASICPSEQVKFTLDERSDELLEKLVQAGLGKKPIIWITHSMGGLIVKNMLCKAFESKQSEVKNVCLNTKGIVFYSTPHYGSRLANLNQATALLLWPSVEVCELRENSPQLKKIHNKFLELVKSVPMNIITFVETKSTIMTALKFNFLLVEPKSGNPGIGEYFEVPQDHLSICKPLSKCSFLYQKVLHMIKEVINETQPLEHEET